MTGTQAILAGLMAGETRQALSNGARLRPALQGTVLKYLAVLQRMTKPDRRLVADAVKAQLGIGQ